MNAQELAAAARLDALPHGGSEADVDREVAAMRRFPPPPGVPHPTATHTLVVTRTGARYLFREHGDRVYATVTGSSSGASLTNKVLAAMPKVLVGGRMHLFGKFSEWLMSSSPVEGWERTDVLTRFTSTAFDEAWCDDLTPREAINVYGRGSDQHHLAVIHAGRCRLAHH